MTTHSGSFSDRLKERLSGAIYADTSDPHRLSIGLVGGDIPFVPPLALLLFSLVGLLLWPLTKRRCRVVPKSLQSLAARVVLVAMAIALALSLITACKEEMDRVGTHPNFAAVSKVASQGPFAWTRNGMYLAVLTMQASLVIGFDTAWLALSVLAMMLYLDRIVVLAEERFLTAELGTEYQLYCDTVPRWISLF